MRHKIILVSFLICSNALLADLVWTPETGWKAEGGLTERFLGEEITARHGLDAMNLAKEEQEKGNDLAALNLYKKVYTEYSTSLLAPEALYQSSIILKNRHQFAEAFKKLQLIITRYPEYPKFNQVIEEEFEIASLLQKGRRPYYWGIIPGFRDYDAAIEYFESIVTNAPFSKYAPMALMNIAVLAQEHKKPEDSIDALDRLINDYPKSDLAPDAYLTLGDVYADLVRGPSYDQGYTKEAIATYEDFLILFPNHARVKEVEDKLAHMRDIEARSKLELGDFYYYYRNNPKAALVYYNETITVEPNSPAAATAKERIELIKDGVPPPKTVVDFLFGPYEEPSTPTYLQEMEIDDTNTDMFVEGDEDLYQGVKLKGQEFQHQADPLEPEEPRIPNVDLPAVKKPEESTPSGENSLPQQQPVKKENKPISKANNGPVR
ncbi:MAG: outer membrane protein assembly factor BamD [Verrucomicrobia bacterium CG_4_9_14_3_um_filter_43_20]|nr:MAG: outer membrane protein assembly factor BamD [Verrucomicrobia bacterium CG_4_9_14_3_um_filter_43_20]